MGNLISVNTLMKYFRREIDGGLALLKFKAGSKLVAAVEPFCHCHRRQRFAHCLRGRVDSELAVARYAVHISLWAALSTEASAATPGPFPFACRCC
jgi:hypothetical protein